MFDFENNKFENAKKILAKKGLNPINFVNYEL